ncbi:protein high chlorophyll fluorescent 107 isoform X2 [Ziziphus jujuba]|uniref:Protein high chlorophyll fluorescent 107 isoform X2 n=1 Tax=Ziziphus jujuba TaxID=326968 RepID=A0A6P6G6J4_ZIZJJ|nr:protein high chlorophyll fluorescent 107 isoform X2 [Ziziphus jujuba]
MHLLSSSPSSSSNPNFNVFSTSQNNSTNLSNFTLKTTILTFHSCTYSLSVPPRCSSSDSSTSVLESTSNIAISDGWKPDDVQSKRETTDSLLVVRRPAMEAPGDGDDDDEHKMEGEDDDDESKSTVIDVGLNEFAKKMPIFEPDKRVESSGSKEKPLTVNLDLALYRAKVLARNHRYAEAENILQKCWAVLENRIGNTRRARELFDAATVADKKHVAAWHGWAVVELKQGNLRKARNLLAKGLKFCGGNEYIYQTLALLEAKANRYEQARYLFRQATKCNYKSCASWLAWAQLEIQQENYGAARQLFEKAIQASPKNRFAWHVWGVFEANIGNFDMGRKLLKIGHALNPRDPVLLQSLALLEYKYTTANLARVMFKRASELDPRHQPVWMAWGWMEWKEGNIATARELYQKALSVDSTSETAARCLQAWGVLEQRIGNLSAARRLFKSSLNINSQSYITWMTWAALEEDQGNAVRAEEIRNLYFQQRTEVVDDASWVMGFLDIIDPALDSVKRLFKMDQNSYSMSQDSLKRMAGMDKISIDGGSFGSSSSGFNLDAFIMERLSLDPSKLEIQTETIRTSLPKRYTRKTSKAIS